MIKLFNVFRKKTVSEIQTISDRYPNVVYQIHKEFYTASDIILNEANEILSREITPTDVQKADRLRKAGFGKVKEVVRLKEEEEEKKTALEMSKIIQSYSMRYPNNKFIIEEDVKKICKKYNLVFGYVKDFIGFVPDKNLKEIESFDLKEEDFMPAYLANSWMSDLLTIRELDIYYGNGIHFHNEISGRKRDILMICAPLKDFDMKGKELDGHKIKLQTPPDPVVLQPVPGGYLIVTAWGDEASDPMVVNHKMN